MTHEAMPQTFSVLQHVMGESLNNGEPDAIRGKHEWTVVAECDVDGLDQRMKKCLRSCKEVGRRMESGLRNCGHCEAPGPPRTRWSQLLNIPFRSNGWDLRIGHDQNRGVGPNLNALT